MCRRASQRHSRVKAGMREGYTLIPMEVGEAFLHSRATPEAFYRLFYPTTPLPECGQVSFLMGGGIHQAGMEQRSGFEPPLPAWKAGVLTVEH